VTLTELTIAVMNGVQDPNGKLLPEPEYEEIVLLSVLKYSGFRPRIRKTTVTLSAGTDTYPAPDGFREMYLPLWGKDKTPVNPWERPQPAAAVPDVFLVAEQLFFTPTPTAGMIAVYGAAFPFLYRSPHIVTDSQNTIPEEDQVLIRTLGKAYACKEIAATPNQADAFVNRYKSLGKRYFEQFEEAMKNPKASVVRS
jgi:hypothetical protein